MVATSVLEHPRPKLRAMVRSYRVSAVNPASKRTVATIAPSASALPSNADFSGGGALPSIFVDAFIGSAPDCGAETLDQNRSLINFL
jgi:hypothetical protein